MVNTVLNSMGGSFHGELLNNQMVNIMGNGMMGFSVVRDFHRQFFSKGFLFGNLRHLKTITHVPTVVDFEATSQRLRTRTQPTGLALVEQVFAAWDTIPRTY
jgi:hypothetical protein